MNSISIMMLQPPDDRKLIWLKFVQVLCACGQSKMLDDNGVSSFSAKEVCKGKDRTRRPKVHSESPRRCEVHFVTKILSDQRNFPSHASEKEGEMGRRNINLRSPFF
jgi:hypothetical protein